MQYTRIPCPLGVSCLVATLLDIGIYEIHPKQTYSFPGRPHLPSIDTLGSCSSWDLQSPGFFLKDAKTRKKSKFLFNIVTNIGHHRRQLTPHRQLVLYPIHFVEAATYGNKATTFLAYKVEGWQRCQDNSCCQGFDTEILIFFQWFCQSLFLGLRSRFFFVDGKTWDVSHTKTTDVYINCKCFCASCCI